MALNADLENALRDWLRLKAEADQAEQRVVTATATLVSVCDKLTVAVRRVNNHAGIGRMEREKFFRIEQHLFRVTYCEGCDPEIKYIRPEE